MKIWKIAGIVSAAVLLASAAALAACRDSGTVMDAGMAHGDGEPEIAERGNAPPEEGMEELHERLKGFAQVIYQYDTDERMYYEGTEEYMTEEAFLRFCPLEASGEGDVQKVRVRSRLIDTESYIRSTGGAATEAIMESRFTLSLTAHGSVVQYLKLDVEKKDGQWFITECQVIDTLEE